MNTQKRLLAAVLSGALCLMQMPFAPSAAAQSLHAANAADEPISTTITTPDPAASETTKPIETTETPTETTMATYVHTASPEGYDFAGYYGFAYDGSVWHFGVGKALSFDNDTLVLHARIHDYSTEYKELYSTRFRVGDGAHEGSFAYDTSKVDVDTPGMYPVYLQTTAGAQEVFRIQNNPYVTTGDYTIGLQAMSVRKFIYIDDGKTKPTTKEPTGSFADTYLEKGSNCGLYLPDIELGAGCTFEICDPNIAAYYYDDAEGRVYVMGIGVGDTHLIIRDAAGKTLSTEHITVSDVQTTTAVITVPDGHSDSTATETTTTTVPVSTPPDGESGSELPFGDLNGDSRVNAADSAELLIDAATFGATGTHTLPEDAISRADSNDDGVVNAGDAANILIYAAFVGADPNLPDFQTFMTQRLSTLAPENVLYLSQTFDGIYNVIRNDWELSDPDAAYTCASHIFTSQADLTAFADKVAENGDEVCTLYLDAVSLHGIAQHYTDDWFRKHDLIAVAFQEPMTGYSYEFMDITMLDDSTVQIEADCILPEFGGAAISGHLLLIETCKTNAQSVQMKVQNVEREISMYPQSFIHRWIDGNRFLELPVVLHSLQEAKEYGLDEMPWLRSDVSSTAYSLDQILANYGENFFDSHSIILLQTPFDSSSTNYRATDVTVKDGAYQVQLVCQRHSEETADYVAHWIMILVDKRDTDSVVVDKTTYAPYLYTIPNDPAAVNYLEGAQYARVGTSASFADMAPVVCKSDDDLEAYFKDPAELPYRNVGGEHSTALAEAVAKYYNTGFFDKSALVIVPVEVGSGSFWFEADSVKADWENANCYVNFYRYEPEVQTCDMAEWYLFVEMPLALSDLTPQVGFTRVLAE